MPPAHTDSTVFEPVIGWPTVPHGIILKEAISEVNINEQSAGFNLKTLPVWFIREQRKIIDFDEGVLVFMLSLALVSDSLIPMLWVFAVSQIFHGMFRTWQRGHTIQRRSSISIKK